MNTSRLISAFWTWLADRRDELDILRHPSEAFWDTILDQLHQIDDGIWFEIGDHPDGTREIVFTAHGDLAVFPIIDSLVAEAPTWPGWLVTALRPADGMMTHTSGYGVEIEADRVWYMLLRHPKKPNIFGIRLAMPGFVTGMKSEPYIHAAWRIIDCLLGERRSATLVKHVEVCEQPSDPQLAGFTHISNLPQHIPW
jgi:hypothetical protein